MGLFDIFKKRKEESAQNSPEQAAEERRELNAGLEKTKQGLFSKLARAVAGRSKVDESRASRQPSRSSAASRSASPATNT